MGKRARKSYVWGNMDERRTFVRVMTGTFGIEVGSQSCWGQSKSFQAMLSFYLMLKYIYGFVWIVFEVKILWACLS